MTSTRITLAILTLALTLSGCALKSPPTHSDVVSQALPKQTHIPPVWKADPRAAGAVTNDWLKTFGDPALEAIVAEAMANNLDLRQAAEQVTIAQQAVAVVGSRLLPQLGASLGGRVIHDSDNGSTTSTIAYTGVAWELDVWGRLRARRAVTEAGYEVTALDYAYARQSLAATVAKAWYLATETRQLVALAEQAVRIYTQLLELVTIRRDAGKVSDLDVVDVHAKLEMSWSQLVVARENYNEVRRALEVLLGRYPAAEIEVAATYPTLPALTGVGFPVALLERRPDLLAAERAVLAAFRRQEAAQLALLPDFSISLVGGRLGNQILSLLRLNPWLASSGIGVSIPIYEGGALQAKVEIATAQQAQAVARYGATVLTAFHEVENALANEQLFWRRLPFDQRALADQTETVRIATIQYQAGRIDLLWVTNLESMRIVTESSLLKLRGAQQINRVQLHLALGGSFDAMPAAVTGGDVIPK